MNELFKPGKLLCLRSGICSHCSLSVYLRYFTTISLEYLSDLAQPKESEREDKVNLYTTKTFIDTKRASFFFSSSSLSTTLVVVVAASFWFLGFSRTEGGWVFTFLPPEIYRNSRVWNWRYPCRGTPKVAIRLQCFWDIPYLWRS